MSGTSELAQSSRPVAATSRGSLLASELDRLRHRRLVTALVLLGLVALLATMAAIFATHGTDVEGAHARARQLARPFDRGRRADEHRGDGRRQRPRPCRHQPDPHGRLGNSEKSGRRFSLNASRPSRASSLP